MMAIWTYLLPTMVPMLSIATTATAPSSMRPKQPDSRMAVGARRRRFWTTMRTVISIFTWLAISNLTLPFPAKDSAMARDYCGPQSFEGIPDSLYRNNGDGAFSDVTAEVGIISSDKGLGVVCADFTSDGWVDLYVANDGEANRLWVNSGSGTFDDEAIMRGLAFNTHGKAEASMGVTVGDADRDGELDLFMTHFIRETNTLYLASPYGIFSDATDSSGFAGIDLPFTGFGCGFFDFDHDADLDIALVNGRVMRGPVLPGANIGKFWDPYAEPNLFF